MSDSTTPAESKSVKLTLIEIPLLPSIIDFMGATEALYAYASNVTYRIELITPYIGNIFTEIPVAVEYGTWDHESESFKPLPKDSNERYTLSGTYNGPVGESELVLHIHTD